MEAPVPCIRSNLKYDTDNICSMCATLKCPKYVTGRDWHVNLEMLGEDMWQSSQCIQEFPWHTSIGRQAIYG